MQAIVKPHLSGKTDDVLRLALEDFSYIVCPTQRDARRLWQRALELGLDIPQPIPWREFLKGRYHTQGVSSFIIDDLDRCVQGMTSVEIKAASLTGVST